MKSSPGYSTRNNAYLFAALAALAALAAVLALLLGAERVTPAEIISALLRGDDGSAAARIVLYARLPRALGCILAGAALAVSGAITQSVLANPLASPGTIGVNAGAGLAAALCCALAPSALWLVPLASFAGAMAAALLVLLMAERTGAAKITLVLAGVAVSNILAALVDAVVTFAPDALNAYSDFRIGSLDNLTLARLAAPALVTALGLAAAFALSNELDVLMLGGEVAESLGLRAGRARVVLLAAAAALAGAAVSFAGLLGFVGLVTPHMLRRFTGDEARLLLPASALGGAALLLLCDTASRLVFAPYQLPVGITLALIGGPFFIWLLLRQRRVRRHD